MVKNITKYFCVVLFLSVYQQTCTMGLGLTELEKEAVKPLQQMVETAGSWILVDNKSPIPQDQPNIPENHNNIQPPAAAAPSHWEFIRDISGNTAQVVAGVPAATKAIIDCKTAMQSEDVPAQPIAFSQEVIAQQESEHRRSQERLHTINTLLQNTNGAFNNFTLTLHAGTQFVQHVTALMQTLQSNPADKGKEEAVCPQQAFEFNEKKRIAERIHTRFLGGQVIGVLRQTDQTVNQFASLIREINTTARELNTGLTTYAGMAAQPPAIAPEERQMIREHERIQTERYRAMAYYGSAMTRNLANAAQSYTAMVARHPVISPEERLMIRDHERIQTARYERITGHFSTMVNQFASAAQSATNIWNSPQFANHASHIGKVATDTSVRLALTGAGLYVFCRNIQDVDKQKHALLAGLGGAMMLSPLVLARLTT